MTIFQYHTHYKNARNYWRRQQLKLSLVLQVWEQWTCCHINPFNTDTYRLHGMIKRIISRSITFTVTMFLVGIISEYNPVSRISHAVIDIWFSKSRISFLLNDDGQKISIVNPNMSRRTITGQFTFPPVEPTVPVTTHQTTNFNSPGLSTRGRPTKVPSLKMHKAFPHREV